MEKFSIDEKDLIFAKGIKFWSELIVTENLTDLTICSNILKTFGALVSDKDMLNLFLELKTQQGKEKEVKPTKIHSLQTTDYSEDERFEASPQELENNVNTATAIDATIMEAEDSDKEPDKSVTNPNDELKNEEESLKNVMRKSEDCVKK